MDTRSGTRHSFLLDQSNPMCSQLTLDQPQPSPTFAHLQKHRRDITRPPRCLLSSDPMTQSHPADHDIYIYPSNDQTKQTQGAQRCPPPCVAPNSKLAESPTPRTDLSILSVAVPIPDHNKALAHIIKPKRAPTQQRNTFAAICHYLPVSGSPSLSATFVTYPVND